MNVKSTTKIYGIFGHPVSHSLSPVMHNGAFRELGFEGVYVAFDVDPESIGEAVNAIRSLGIHGINVTVPHKESVIIHLDEISADARLVGAVNTISNVEGRLIGFNTDVNGLLRAISDDLNFSFEEKKVFLIGAGGAARAVIVGLGRSCASEVIIANRTLSKAELLAKEFREHFSSISIKTLILQDEEKIKTHIKSCDIVINASSTGMAGKNSLDIPLHLLSKDAVVYDLVYEPRDTQLVKDANRAGILASSGLSMLLYQGAESFKIWTGIDPPIQTMKKALDTL